MAVADQASRSSRRSFLRSGLAIACSAPLALARSRPYAAQVREPSETDLLTEAEAGIRRYRQSDGVLRVRGDGGRPLAGVRVRIEQRRQEFLFGANCFLWDQPGEPGLQKAYRERFAGVFNAASLGVFWAAFEPERGQPRYAALDAVIDWCRDQGIQCCGTPLVWPNLPDPAWLPTTAAGIRAASHQRVRELVSRYRGRIDRWVVVNEPTMLPWATTRLGAWAQLQGTLPYVAEHLRVARAANPKATLLVNDCLTEVPLYPVLEALREGGRPLFDAVGIQSHMHPGPWPLHRVRSVCDEFARLGLPLHFTETTVLSGNAGRDGVWRPTNPAGEAAQADYTEQLYTVLFGHPAVREVAWWDVSDRYAWKGAPAGLIRQDMSPKPAYERLRRLIRERWWTRVRGETDAQGQFRFRAFHGMLELRLDGPGRRTAVRQVPWLAGQTPPIDVRLDAGSGRVRKTPG